MVGVLDHVVNATVFGCDGYGESVGDEFGVYVLSYGVVE